MVARRPVRRIQLQGVYMRSLGTRWAVQRCGVARDVGWGRARACGRTALDEAWADDLRARQWRNRTPSSNDQLDPPRNHNSVVRVGRDLLIHGGDVAGGVQSCGAPFPQNPVAELWRFDLAHDRFRRETTSEAKPRDRSSATKRWSSTRRCICYPATTSRQSAATAKPAKSEPRRLGAALSAGVRRTMAQTSFAEPAGQVSGDARAHTKKKRQTAR
jgi:hypothetical protein